MQWFSFPLFNMFESIQTTTEQQKNGELGNMKKNYFCNANYFSAILDFFFKIVYLQYLVPIVFLSKLNTFYTVDVTSGSLT